jgi:glycosyltransferase involved in cell wall biosynthesis
VRVRTTAHSSRVVVEVKVAFIAFPSGAGGGLALYESVVPLVVAEGGSVMWIDHFYDTDRERVGALTANGAVINQAWRPQPWIKRWVGRVLGEPEPPVRELVEFGPDVVVVVVGMHAPEDEASWRLKKSMTDAAKAVGAKIVMQHQYSVAGEWIPDLGGSAAEWLAWQRGADLHQYVSEGTRKETERNFGFSMPAEIIRNTYNVPYNGELPWLQDEVLRMGFVGVFRVWQKGLDVLLEACEIVAAKAPGQWTLDLAGDGEMSDRLKTEVRQRGLEGEIRFTGRHRDIHEFWRTRHVNVMPSRAEGLSLALVEGMLSGRPAIASMVGGTAELLEDGVTGLVCKIDAENLAGKMMEAIELNRAGKFAKMGGAAAAKARAVFPEHPAEQYAKQLLAIAESGKRPPDDPWKPSGVRPLERL